jgi:acetyl esterase/lipase
MSSIRSHVVRFLIRLSSRGFAASVPVEKLRVNYEAMGRLTPARGVEVQPLRAGDVPAEWLVPPNPARDCVILYLHGGGWVMGSCATERDLAARIARASAARVLTIDYRLAPEHPFPAALEDAACAYRWLLDQGFAPHNTALAGTSAGGGLCVALLVALLDASDPLPAAAALISPGVDLAGTGESIHTRAKADPMLDWERARVWVEMYAAGQDRRHPLLSPIYADLHGLPPLLIHVGTDEILLSDSERLAERARAAGVDVTLEVWEHMWHAWHAFAAWGLPEGAGHWPPGAVPARTPGTGGAGISRTASICRPVTRIDSGG